MQGHRGRHYWLLQLSAQGSCWHGAKGWLMKRPSSPLWSRHRRLKPLHLLSWKPLSVSPYVTMTSTNATADCTASWVPFAVSCTESHGPTEGTNLVSQGRSNIDTKAPFISLDAILESGPMAHSCNRRSLEVELGYKMQDPPQQLCETLSQTKQKVLSLKRTWVPRISKSRKKSKNPFLLC